MKRVYMVYLLIVLLLLTAAGCGQSASPTKTVDVPAPDPMEETVKDPDTRQDTETADQVPAANENAAQVDEAAPDNEVELAEPSREEPDASKDYESTSDAESVQPERSEAQVPQEQEPKEEPNETESVYTQEVQVAESVPTVEAVVLQEAPAAVPVNVKATPSGTLEKRCDKAVIDYSNTKDGYVMVQYTASSSRKLKCRVAGPGTTYTYNLTAGEWATFSLSDGDGSYMVSVFENVVDTKYATVLTASFEVKAEDEFAPFLMSNQYVNYKSAPNTVAKAAELAQTVSDPLKKVEAVYDYVVTNLTYDKQLAQTVQSGYLPVLDTVLAKKTGICFDYAALMAGMLRSQGVPCKLVVGYAGEAYHAWINVWTEETGWVDGIIFFDGHAWKRMDPTFASSANASTEIMEYIGNGANYTAKYVY